MGAYPIVGRNTGFVSSRILTCCLVGGLLLYGFAVAQVAGAADLERGAALFELCASCHGPEGGGNHLFGAPAIAGLHEWYVAAQLDKFRSSIRGAHPLDIQGLRMRPMALTLRREGDVAALASYVAGLTSTRPEPSLEGGNAERGKALFVTCGVCHGAAGEGNKGMNGPRLTHVDDWYLLTQLENFKAGIRGGDSRDPNGILMRSMAGTLPDDQSMKDVIAHIQLLSK